jgi:hypothetical protein
MHITNAQPTVTIQLTGGSTVLHEVNTPYEDAGFTALDSANNDYRQFVSMVGAIDTTLLGGYSLVFSIPAHIAVSSSQMRLVQVVDRTAPSIIVLGANPATVMNHSAYFDEGIKISDNYYSVTLLNNLVSITTSPGLSYNGSSFEFTSDTVFSGIITYVVTDPSGNTSNTATRILMRSVTGINELSKSSTLIYPNPARAELHIKSAKSIDQCVLINTLGQRFQFHWERDGEGAKATIANIPSGIYVMIWESDGIMQSANIMISP